MKTGQKVLIGILIFLGTLFLTLYIPKSKNPTLSLAITGIALSMVMWGLDKSKFLQNKKFPWFEEVVGIAYIIIGLFLVFIALNI